MCPASSFLRNSWPLVESVAMEQSPVQFAKTADGLSIAWTQAGNGPLMIMMPALNASLSGSWIHFPDWFQEVTRHFTVVQYDGRGHGLSSRDLSADLTMSDLGLDLEAVVSQQGQGAFILYASGGTTHVALRYAAAHPERVQALVLNTCAVANASWGMTYWRALPSENFEYFRETLLLPGLTVEERKEWIERSRTVSTFHDYDIYSRVLMDGVIEDVLPQVQTPALVIHQTWRTTLPREESMRVAASLPNGRFALDSATSYYPDPTTVQVIVDFVAQTSPVSSAPAAESGQALAIGLLSQREVEVLGLVAQGKTSQEIAAELVISPFTVNRHISNIYSKIGAANRAEAASFATRHGIA